MTSSFEGSEVAQVLAAALLGMEDDQVLTVEVHMPDGSRRALDRAWFEAQSSTLILDVSGRPVLRVPSATHWTDRYLDEFIDGYGYPLRSVYGNRRGVRRTTRRVVNDPPPSDQDPEPS